jgi:hypothetical protein
MTGPTCHRAVLSFVRCRNFCLQLSECFSFTGVVTDFFPSTNTYVFKTRWFLTRTDSFLRGFLPHLRPNVLRKIMIAVVLSEADMQDASCDPNTVSKHRYFSRTWRPEFEGVDTIGDKGKHFYFMFQIGIYVDTLLNML